MNKLPCLNQLVLKFMRRKKDVTRDDLETILNGGQYVDVTIELLRNLGVIGNCSIENGKVMDFQVLPPIRDIANDKPYCEGYGKKSGPRHHVFVVHGRDDDARSSITSFLKSRGLKPITFEDAILWTGKAAPTTNEILTAGMDNAYAVIVLFTGDEEARLKPDLKYRRKGDGPLECEPLPQPRQNVIFEAGMAWARFPDRTVLVQYGPHLRPMSDIAGVHVVQFSGTLIDRRALAERLWQAGCRRITSKQKVKVPGTGRGT